MALLGAVASLVIVAAYALLALTVPRALLEMSPPTRWGWIRYGVLVGGGAFFLTCAVTHLDEAAHLLANDASGKHLAEPAHVVNCWVQAIAVGWFALALPRYLRMVHESLHL